MAQPFLFGTVENAELDLQRGDAFAGNIGLEAGFINSRLHACCVGNPAVAVADQGDEKGTAAGDLVQADLQDQQFLLLLFIDVDGEDAPAEIDRREVMPPFEQPIFQFRKHVVSQPVPFRLHVAERGRDKDRT